MTPSLPIAAIVRDLLQARSARPIVPEDFATDVALGAEGLGLDSIAIAEVLLQCEEQFGVDALTLLQERPLTLRRLAMHLDRAATG